MTDKELRKLKRVELIEILYYMRNEIDELQAANQRLETRIDQLIGNAQPQQEISEPAAENVSAAEEESSNS